ncbi:MAG: ACT domain-containing protein [Acidimicrobiales bacterium]
MSRRLGGKRRATGSAGVHVEGLDDIMIRLSRCCSPVPPDEIIGFVTRGRGVSVHRSDCLNAATLQEGQPDRLIEVEWDAEHEGRFATTIEVQALDRSSLLVDVAKVLADHGLNVVGVATETGADAVAKMQFEFELADVSQLDSVLSSLLGVEAVYDAYRVLPGGATPVA